MIAIGLILILIGVAGAWNGPVDTDYAQDWMVWIFFVILGLIGFVFVVNA
jgi:hypothetical protein